MKNLYKTNAAFFSRLSGQVLITLIFCLSFTIVAIAQTDFANSKNQEIDAETLQRIKTSKSARKDFINQLEMESGRQANPGMLPQSFLNSENLSGDTTGNGLDPAFANITLEDAYTRVERVAVQPDGKILVGGSFTQINGVRRYGLIRLNANGTLDTSFNAGNTGPNSQIDEIVVQPDGKIMIGGFFNAYNGVARSRIARLNSDGTLDTSFDPGVGANTVIYDIKILPDSKILASGAFTFYNNIAANRIVRLNANGTQDNSFVPPTTNNQINEMALQTDGRILIGGNFNLVGGLTRNGVARLNADGTHDTTFDPTTNTATYTTSFIIQPDGKIIVGAAYDSTGGNKNIVRLNSNGSLDNTFVSAYPAGLDSTLHDMILQPDGKILAAGFFNAGLSNPQIGYGVVRFNTNGSLDSSFSQSTFSLGNNSGLEAFSMALTPGGQIVVGGDFYKYSDSTISKRIAILNSNGTVDNSYNVLIEAEGYARTTVRQSDGKIIVGGSFLRVNGVSRNDLARLNADGTLDNSFNPAFDSDIYTLALQPDGKILVGGRFTVVNGFEANSAARLNSDGSIDGTFVTAADVGCAIYLQHFSPAGR